jgi:hypothetical protein
MPEGTRLDPRRPEADRPVEPPTERLERATTFGEAPDPRNLPTADMPPEKFRDYFRYFNNDLDAHRSAVWTLYDQIRACPGGVDVLSPDAAWVQRWNERPPAPAFSNPLQVKFQSQNDNLSGTGWRECFSSSMAMIAMYWGKVKNDDEYNKIRARYGDTTDPNAQIKALESLGLKPTYIQNGTVATLENEINEGRPVGVGWLHNGPVSRPSGGGHWTVVIGHNSSHWIHNDPNGVADLVNGGYTNNWNGESVSYSRQNWNPRWLVYSQADGWAMLVRP